jgi:hypothetical protein
MSLNEYKYIKPVGAPSGGKQVVESGLDGDDQSIIIGQFVNGTATPIVKGQWLNAAGIDETNDIKKAILLNVTSPAFSSAPLGMCIDTSVAVGAVGRYIRYGAQADINTVGLTLGGPMYASDIQPGGLTSTRPKAPNKIIVLGTPELIGASGKVFVDISPFRRIDVSAASSFTSAGIGAGTYYKDGFYDWSTTGITLSHLGASTTYGTAGRTYAAHVGIVASGPGIVSGGQVGMRVTGTRDNESGTQSASYTGIITDDITTLVANQMIETSEKFSGNVTIELYVVSGTPSTYEVSVNYGYSKYEDFFDRNATVVGFQALWQGNATDSGFNIRLLHHRATGWTYSSGAFTPGDGAICERLVDQAIESNVVNGLDGAYKRKDLNRYVASAGGEGVMLEITTTAANTIQTMDTVILAVGEDLV